MGNIVIADDFINGGYTRMPIDFKCTITSEEIRKIGINKPRDLLTIYYAIISNDPNYDLTEKGLGTQWDMCDKKVRSVLKQLEELGYLRRVDLNKGGVSYLFIAFHQPIYAKMFDEFIKDFKLQCSRSDLMMCFKAFVDSKMNNTQAEKANAEKANANLAAAKNAPEINNKNNLNKNKFTIKILTKAQKILSNVMRLNLKVKMI